MRRARTCRWLRMRPCRVLLRGQGVFFAAQSSADCITSMAGFDLRQAHPYLAATGQMVSSVVTLIVGELLKLVLVERLFSLTRDKLMKIPAFVWAYTKF